MPMEYSWEPENENISECSSSLGHRALYSPHSFPKLKSMSQTDKDQLNKKLEETKNAG
jgi:hypothetical protein